MPTLVFLTVCTRDRRPWLADDLVHETLRLVWRSARTWLVGRYVLMPDHLHLFCAPASARPELSLEAWVRYWKSRFSRIHSDPACQWQSGHSDTRLRRSESYDGKWQDVVDNPVRAGLVASAAEWPFAGELRRLEWR